MAPNTRIMPSPIGPTQMTMNPRSRDSPSRGSRDGGSDKQPSRVPVMNMNRDRPTSEKSQRTGDTGGIRQSMSFYHLLREIQPTVKDKYSVITFVLTVVGSILCFLPFYAYMILANNDNGQGGISNMSGLNLDTSIDYSVSMKNSVSSGNQDTDSALFHAINRYCSILLVHTYSLITLFCYTHTLSHITITCHYL